MIPKFQKQKNRTITIYETPPTWRTIKAGYDQAKPPDMMRFYLYFPYMQFVFIECPVYTDFYIYASKEPFPKPSITFYGVMLSTCLGDNWEIEAHSHNQNIEQYWNGCFHTTTEYDMRKIFEFEHHTNLYKNKLYQTDIEPSKYTEFPEDCILYLVNKFK